jgi:protein-export membrane protein SecD/preprotein translocase SecF subunit
MLENANRQLFLVLLSIVAAIVCVLTMKPVLGHDLKGGTQLRYEVPEEALVAMQQKENRSIDEMMDQSIRVIRDRIDPAGTLDPNIQKSGRTGILIELPWFEHKQERDAVLQRIANLGKLEMRIVADDDYRGDGNVQFQLAAEVARLKAWLAIPENKAAIAEDPLSIRRFNEDASGTGPVAFGNLGWYPRYIRPTLKAGGDQNLWEESYSNYPKVGPSVVKAFEDADYNNRVIPESWKAKPEAERRLVEFIALNLHERHFTGEQLNPTAVGVGQSPDGGIGVNYAMQEGATGDYAEWSEQYTGKCSAIVLNGVVKSAPAFIGKINGPGIITGDFTQPEVEELVKVLKTGSLRVEPVLVSNDSIGPTLGLAAIKRGAWSLVAGAVLVFAFMLVYYRAAGTIACVTLVLNVFLLFGAMLFMQATITLPGLGGIVLTMGMAVDANVLIYERIREELAKGKDLLRSVRAGFERAMSAILDSNITTFLVGMVLYNVGVGPVRGFAVTLMVGIVTTVFTQFFVTRLLFHYALERKWLADYKPRSLFANLNLDYVRLIKPCLVASTVVIVAGMAYALFVVPREVLLGIDFTGGANLRMMVSAPLTDEAVRTRLNGDAEFAREYPNVQVNRFGEPNPDGTATQFNLRIKLNDAQRERIEGERKADRAARKELEEKPELAPPPPYQPPYVAALRRLFDKELAQAAFSEPIVAPLPNRENLQNALLDVHLQTPVDVATTRDKLAKGLSGVVVTPLGEPTAVRAKDLRLEWTTQSSVKRWEIPGVVQKELAALTDVENRPITLSEPFPDASEIHGRLVGELRNSAIGALLLAWGLIVLYLRVRFHEYKYGIAAVVALVHDVLIAFAAVALFNHLGLVHAELDLAMIACFLTIIGYSVNDTIVIFDRIRENATDNARLGVNEPFRDLINRALNQTMSRTILTSGLTLLVVIAQFVVNWGSESGLESFAFAMIIGMVSGVYSTIYIAAPILLWLDKGDLSRPSVPQQEPAAVATTPAAP